MMILAKDGHIYRAVPNLILKKDKRGNWSEEQDGLRPDGCPLMKVVFFENKERSNPALIALLASGELLDQS